MSSTGHVELDWAVDSILVGVRHRTDYGDIQALADSIAEVGLLQPVTITPDGVLICGARRLAALKHLGLKTANVWVRSGLSNKLLALMAERDDNLSHKSYSTTELARLYEELKAEISADAVRRQEATRFMSPEHTSNGNDGAGNFPAPQMPHGDSREQASAMLGGQASYKTLEKVLAIKHLCTDEKFSPELRARAAAAMLEIDKGAPVDPLFVDLRTTVQVEELEHIGADDKENSEVREAAKSGSQLMRSLFQENQLTTAEMERAARHALTRVMKAKEKTTPKPKKTPAARPSKKKTPSHFKWVWGEMATWPDDYDIEAIATEIPDPTWLAFKHTISLSIEFMEIVDQLRASRSFAN